MATVWIALLCVSLCASISHALIPASDVCTVCACASYPLPFDGDITSEVTIDCSATGQTELLADWPSQLVGGDNRRVRVVASFSGNALGSLKQLPPLLPAAGGQGDAVPLDFSCRHCSLQDIAGGALVDVPGIEALDLSWNDLTGKSLPPELFRGHYKDGDYEPLALLVLQLQHNKIHSLQHHCLEHLPHLQELWLGHNPLQVLDSITVMTIETAKELRLLDLSFTGLTVLPDDLLWPLHNLRELYLQGNAFTQVPESLTHRSLQVLNIAENPIQALDAESFLGLQQLRRINVSSLPSLTRVKSGTFTQLRELEVLEMSNCKALQDIDNGTFGESDVVPVMPKLTQLNLSGGGLTKLPADVLLMASLQHLKLQGNPWTCDCTVLSVVISYPQALQNDRARCATPYDIAGHLLNHVSRGSDCPRAPPLNSHASAMHLSDVNTTATTLLPSSTTYRERRMYGGSTRTTSPLRRPGPIMLAVGSVLAVVGVGIVIGLAVVAIRKRIRAQQFLINQPVRYTTVEEI